MPSKQKLGLAVLFSLAILIVGCDVARTIINVDIYAKGMSAPYIGGLLNLLEVELAVIVSTLVTFRALFRKRDNSNKSSENRQQRQAPLKNNIPPSSTDGRLEHLTAVP